MKDLADQVQDKCY